MSLIDTIVKGEIHFIQVKDVEILALRLDEERKNPSSHESRFLKACCLMYGKCIDKDTKLAFQLFKELLVEGYIAAKYYLACLFLDSNDIDKNPEQAFLLTSQSAETDHIQAIINLAGFYWNGNCIPTNKEIAVHWMKRALEISPDYPIALHQLAIALWSGVGIEMDKERAIKMYLQAAEKKHFPSAKSLSIIAGDYIKGTRGLEKNKEKGGEILFKLIQMRYDFAMHQLYKYGQDGDFPMEMIYS